MVQSSIRQRIERNMTIWFLGALLTGFVSGIGVYRAVQEIAGLKTVSAAELETWERRRTELEGELRVSNEHAAVAVAQVRQAYWAIRGTQVHVMYLDGHAHDAVEIKERLGGAGAFVTLRALDQQRYAGKVFFGPTDREAAMQIKALLSDIASLHAEEGAVDGVRPGEVSIW